MDCYRLPLTGTGCYWLSTYFRFLSIDSLFTSTDSTYFYRLILTLYWEERWWACEQSSEGVVCHAPEPDTWSPSSWSRWTDEIAVPCFLIPAFTWNPLKSIFSVSFLSGGQCDASSYSLSHPKPGLFHIFCSTNNFLFWINYYVLKTSVISSCPGSHRSKCPLLEPPFISRWYL